MGRCSVIVAGWALRDLLRSAATGMQYCSACMWAVHHLRIRTLAPCPLPPTVAACPQSELDMHKGEANRLRREMERVEGERERLREEARRWGGS